METGGASGRERGAPEGLGDADAGTTSTIVHSRSAKAKHVVAEDAEGIWLEVDALDGDATKGGANAANPARLPIVRRARWKARDVFIPRASEGLSEWSESSLRGAGAAGSDGAKVHVLLYSTPCPPLVRVSTRIDGRSHGHTTRDSAAVDGLETESLTGLEWATRAMEEAGRMVGGGSGRVGGRASGAVDAGGEAGRGLLARATAAALGALDARVIPGLKERHNWVGWDKGGETLKWRNACEVFATAHVLRSRLRWLNGTGGPSGFGDAAIAHSSRAALGGRALQAVLDLALGCLTASLLLTREDAIVRVVMGGSWSTTTTISSSGPPMPLGGETVRANANWIMRGDPLGVKLHAPLAAVLGAAALQLVESLGVVLEQPGCAAFFRRAVRCLAASGAMGGFSLQAALAADLTTFLTTHIGALHVYSSLLVTAQLAAAQWLYCLINPPRNKGAADHVASGADEGNRQHQGRFAFTRLEATTAGVLALTPVMLLLPTTLAFYLSYLALHALTISVRAAMVLASAALQYPPLQLLAIKLAHPHAFPGGVAVVPVVPEAGRGGCGGDAVRYVRVEARGAGTGVLLRPFVTAAAEWGRATAAAVVGACASCGRLPVALVPFEPEELEYF